MATAAKKAPAKTAAKKAPAKKAPAKKDGGSGFSAEERAAMKEAARERRARTSGKGDGLADVLGKIAAMADGDRAIAEKVHALVLAAAPDLEVRTWYGMPAYAKNGKVVCFFQDAGKFKARYCTLGFQDAANLDDGGMWPTAFAIIRLTKADEKRITELVRRAVS